MENPKEHNGWMSVPQFGGWDQMGGAPDYSMVFSRARENRKQQRFEIVRPTLDDDEKFIAAIHHDEYSPTKRKKIMSYLCCIKV
ncbi:hypothetical protein AAC387_Pa01g1711 [Persea americana]